MTEESFMQKIVLDAIAGKNKAVHAYDKILWTVRSGYLTLFFAGWGIILRSIVEKDRDIQMKILPTMLVVSVALSAGGWIVDRNYLRRKFRVIHAIDELMSTIARKGEQVLSSPREIEEYLKISGDKKDPNYLKVDGYPPAWRAGVAIYLIPIIMAGCVALLFWIFQENPRQLLPQG
jgi:hypothetical protein